MVNLTQKLTSLIWSYWLYGQFTLDKTADQISDMHCSWLPFSSAAFLRAAQVSLCLHGHASHSRSQGRFSQDVCLVGGRIQALIRTEIPKNFCSGVSRYHGRDGHRNIYMSSIYWVNDGFVRNTSPCPLEECPNKVIPVTDCPFSKCYATFSRYSALGSDFKLKLGDGLERTKGGEAQKSPDRVQQQEQWRKLPHSPSPLSPDWVGRSLISRRLSLPSSVTAWDERRGEI